jgi:hypothetical protein
LPLRIDFFRPRTSIMDCPCVGYGTWVTPFSVSHPMTSLVQNALK